jgi:hypothetical protein
MNAKGTPIHLWLGLTLGLGAILGSTAGAMAEPRVFELAIRDGRLPEDRRVVRVRQGDEVTLRFTTDRPLALHLHGYDVEENAVPGTPVAMRFTARATGRFPIETHGSGGSERTIGYLEVHPR